MYAAHKQCNYKHVDENDADWQGECCGSCEGSGGRWAWLIMSKAIVCVLREALCSCPCLKVAFCLCSCPKVSSVIYMPASMHACVCMYIRTFVRACLHALLLTSSLARSLAILDCLLARLLVCLLARSLAR